MRFPSNEWLVLQDFFRFQVAQFSDEFQSPLAHGPHEWIAGQRDQFVQKINCLIDQPVGARALA